MLPAADDDETTSLTEEGETLSIAQLPPMPRPRRAEQLGESTLGVFVVTVLVGLLVGVTHGIAVGPGTQNNNWLPLLFIYAEAALAYICLLGLLCADPGTIKRTRATCYPIPPDVAARLKSGEPLTDLAGNISRDGRSYCVRCLVWRDKSADSRFEGSHSIHHCSTCQRCVVDFDHHCGVFGRCIAGSGFSGNMKYFKGILFCFAAGITTCIVSTVIKLTEGKA